MADPPTYSAKLWCIVRSTDGKLWKFHSPDHGDSWSHTAWDDSAIGGRLAV